MKYGLVGEKLPHSFSKEIHQMLGGYEYEIFETDEKGLKKLLSEKSFCALNVTIPYKQTVIAFTDELDSTAKAIGAVNTVVNRDGKLFGFNTDYLGLKALIEKNGVSLKDKTVLILGTGGTSKTAQKVASDLGAKNVLRVSRSEMSGDISYKVAYENYSNAQIIINTTPVGMYPNVEGSPIDLYKFTSLEAVFDAVYNPLRTDLVLEANKLGAVAEGGLYMLVSQAVFASELFLNKKYEKNEIDRVFKKILSGKENIVLSGMPGSGKSTVGKILAEKLNKTFVDTDKVIEKEEQMKISEIFSIKGEQYFRNKESEVIKRYSVKANNLVLALGGGGVLRAENVKALKRNGKIYFLNRSLDDIIPTSDRPLAQSKADLNKRFRERYRLYKDSADKEISVNSSAEEVAEIIGKDFLCHENKN